MGKLDDSLKAQVVRLYTDIEFPAAFGSVANFKKSLAVEKNIHIKYEDLKKILERIPIYQMHVLTKRRFARRSLRAKGAGIDFHADLGYMPPFNKYTYFLLMVDLYSNYIYVVPLKSKTAEATRKAFDHLFDTFHLDKFSSLGTDAGGEFTGNREYLKEKGVELYIRRGDNKAFQAENYIRIFKHVLYKYLRQERSQNWPSAVDRVVSQINNRRQRGLGSLTPAQVNNPLQDPVSRGVIKRKRYSDVEEKPKKLKKEFRKNAFVFVNFKKEPLFKGFDTQRGTIYQIAEVDDQESPRLYSLKELDGTPVRGKYYAAELKSAPNPKDMEHEVEKIISRRTDKSTGKKQFLVKWLFYPSKCALFLLTFLTYVLCMAFFLPILRLFLADTTPGSRNLNSSTQKGSQRSPNVLPCSQLHRQRNPRRRCVTSS